MNWRQRDTAVYVVSTVNLLRTGSGRPLATAAAHQWNVIRYEVYADQTVRDLYFIQFRRLDGNVAGALAYQMGWLKPQSVTSGLNALGVAPAPDKIATEYHSDHLVLFGSFASTMPR